MIADAPAGPPRRGPGRPRILVVALAPLAPESGAGQMALNLAAALRSHGAEAVVWSPYPLPPGLRWFRRVPHMRRALERQLAAHGPFDVVDAPAVAITRRVAAAATAVCRSVQPEAHYELAALRARGVRPARRLAHALHAAYVIGCAVRGWARARRILCLGSLEHAAMRRWLPWWRAKLDWYVSAPGAADRAALADVRAARARPADGARRFCWIGRPVRHKGWDTLLAHLARHLAARPHDAVTIAGCGALRSADLPPALRTSGRVRVVPEYSRSELPALLAAHDAGLFTSRVEGWGLCVNEMLESGMPVYATVAGGVPDLAPYFAGALRRFPPPLDRAVEASPPGDLGAYLHRFDWAEIARAYLERLDGAVPARA